MMKWDTALRSVGVLGLVAAYGLYRFSEGAVDEVVFYTIVVAILGIVSPEAIDQLPFGPSKE